MKFLKTLGISGGQYIVQIYRNIIQKLKALKNYSAIFKNALLLTKSENLKGMDAIHVAIAEHHNCQLFVTSDPHFRNLKIISPQLIDLSKSVAR
jgi:predicted nucleic acid-binding protein